MTRPRVALAHDYLTQRGGAERVVLSLLKAFPDAPLYTNLYDPDGTFPEFRDARIITSGLNRVGFLRRDHRKALPLLAVSTNSLRIDADVVVASSTGWAHGFPTTGRKLVYCHSPARFLYLSEQYLGDAPALSPARLALRALRPALIRWDQRAARSADRYLCNSSVIRQRIRDVYGIDAEVVPPPAGVRAEGDQAPVASLQDWVDEGWYQVVSRLMPYKNVQQVVEAFRGLPDKLVIIGRGPLGAELRPTLPPNVRLFEGLSDAELRWTYAHSRALIAASHEDFGLTPLEAGAFGKPCLALHAGGYLDTIAPGVNGAFFPQATPEAIRDAVAAHRGSAWDVPAILQHVDAFSEDRFIARLRAAVADLAR